MTREACGHWFFTWNAFRVECDPQAVVDTVRSFDPPLPILRDGAIYSDTLALVPAPAPLKKMPSTAATSTFSAKLAIDPKVVQQGLAQADVVVGEISRKPVTLDAALVAHAKDVVSGTIEVTIDADSSGKWNRIATVLRKTTKKADGAIENETVTETLRRHLVSAKRL